MDDLWGSISEISILFHRLECVKTERSLAFRTLSDQRMYQLHEWPGMIKARNNDGFQVDVEEHGHMPLISPKGTTTTSRCSSLISVSSWTLLNQLSILQSSVVQLDSRQ
ncbi:hypothetical protein VNO77_34325 [Canavalia gladiata]|uniref:Uncharacterized protein n=1 Tax=Canavalia gladiata TaxID=3824 RepID=A0AAN9Q1P2_CANGL